MQPAAPKRSASRGMLAKAKPKGKAAAAAGSRPKISVNGAAPAPPSDVKPSKASMMSRASSAGPTKTKSAPKLSMVSKGTPAALSKEMSPKGSLNSSPKSDAATATPKSPQTEEEEAPAGPTASEFARIRRMTHELQPYMLPAKPGPMAKSSGLFIPPEAQCPCGIEEEEEDASPQMAVSSTVSGAEVTKDDAQKKPLRAGVEYIRRRSSMYQADFSPCIEFEVKIWGDDYRSSKHCLPSGELKPRRPMPQMKASELLNGLRRSGDELVFAGPINGWAAFSNMALRAITARAGTMRRSQKDENGADDSSSKGREVGGMLSMFRSAAWGTGQDTVMWKANEGKRMPTAPQLGKGTKAIFMAPAWTAIGWAPWSPGFVWWFSEMHGEPRCLFGEQMQRDLDSDDVVYSGATATGVHAFAHRYAVSSESIRDLNTWHTGVLIEWSHGEFCTLVEVAWLNGVGGYGGKSNWCADKLDPNPVLYRTMPDSFKRPYDNSLSEIRMIDMPVKNKDDFLENWLLKYSNKGSYPIEFQRFFDPTIYASGQCRIRDMTPRQLAGFCLNYIWRCFAYEQMSANCQTFAADLYGFLTGTKGASPFTPFLRPQYQQRTMSFLYRPAYTEKSTR